MLSVDYGAKTVSKVLSARGLGAALSAARARAETEAETLINQPPGFVADMLHRNSFAAIEDRAAHIQNQATNVILLGTGGSSLGAQAALALAPNGRGPEIRTPDSLCPFDMDRLVDALDPENTHIIVVSKSGSTVETLAQLAVLHEGMRKRLGDLTGNHYTVITEPGPRALRHFAETVGALVIDHPTTVGGRFSVFTPVGLLPMAVAGMDLRSLYQGAQKQWADFVKKGAESEPSRGAALHQALYESRQISQVVLMPYLMAYRAFGRWYAQLWAESLGKGGRGTTPVRAIGPVDQHSQLQLFLDGPDDKLITVIRAHGLGTGPAIPSHIDDTHPLADFGLEVLEGRTIGDIVACQRRATIETLRGRGRIVRDIDVAEVDEAGIGALFLHFMLETIMAARLMAIDPYDQPAVEIGKGLTRKYLQHLNDQD